MGRLVEVTDHVLVGTSRFCTTTSTVVLNGDGACLVVDPAVTPADIAELAADLHQRGLQVAAGFSTHPHWDHVLWSADLGTSPRYGTVTAVHAAADGRKQSMREVQEIAPGHDLDLVGRLTPLPPGTTSLPWEGPPVAVIEHRAHAPGHAALYVVDDDVLIAGDMCSDREIPLLDLHGEDPVGDYRHALDLFAAIGAEHVVPGHGTVGVGGEFRRRLDADLRYLDELAAGRGWDDPRLTKDWLIRDHRSHLRYLGRDGAGS